MLASSGSRPSFAPKPEIPAWAGEVGLMLKMGWTEKQLEEENTVLRLKQIGAYLETEAKAEKIRQIKVPDPNLQKLSSGMPLEGGG